MWVIDENGELVGECWNCKGQEVAIVEFSNYISLLCLGCGEPQTVGVHP